MRTASCWSRTPSPAHGYAAAMTVRARQWERPRLSLPGGSVLSVGVVGPDSGQVARGDRGAVARLAVRAVDALRPIL